MYEDFKAMAQGRVDYSEVVILIESNVYGHMMCICIEEAAIYSTK